jgi:hypothetical protein
MSPLPFEALLPGTPMEHGHSNLIVYGATVLLGLVVLPVWMAMGLADYFCHRATDIEHTAGTQESLLHLVQFGLVGIPLTAALFLQVNAALLVVTAIFVVLHHVVAYIDVRYANATRQVRPVEQMVHSFLEILPITAYLLVAVLGFGQMQAIFGFGGEEADFALRIRRPPLPGWYIASLLATAFLLNLVPYFEELVRCVRMQRSTPQEQHIEYEN